MLFKQTILGSTERYNVIGSLVFELSRMNTDYVLDAIKRTGIDESLKLEMVNKVLVTNGHEPLEEELAR